jgi:heme-degrading monooxygenase HmoA
MIVDLITFHVRNGKDQEFEAHQQDWIRLMRRSRGFITQVMLKSLEEPGEYLAEVRWVNRDYRDRFSSHEDKESKALVQKSSSILEGPPIHRLLESV